jgi:hypothetical protein
MHFSFILYYFQLYSLSAYSNKQYNQYKNDVVFKEHNFLKVFMIPFIFKVPMNVPTQHFQFNSTVLLTPLLGTWSVYRLILLAWWITNTFCHY